MSSFARSALACLSLALQAVSPGWSQAAESAVPPGLGAAVAGAIASLWGVDSAGMRLQWGAVPAAAVLAADTPFQLLGKGDDGWFVLRVEPKVGSPAAVRVRAGAMDSVQVAARALAMNAALSSADIRTESRVRWGRPPAVGARVAEGWVTRRPMAQGDLLSPANVRAPQVIRAGEPVRLEWQRGTVMIALDGVALNSAGLGEAVRVRLGERGGQRSGRASGPGAVRLDS
jgi:flagella basal body P-ring formation protein FlgA